MQLLRTLIEESRDWASVERGRDLLAKVAYMLEKTFGIESGFLVYRKQFIPDVKDSTLRAYNPWGINYTEEKLTQLLHEGAWLATNPETITDGWVPLHNAPQVWQTIWQNTSIAYVGVWHLVVKGQRIGAIVVGQTRQLEELDADILATCAMHVSLIYEMLLARHLAEDASRRDPLTNLLNRRGLVQQMAQLCTSGETPMIIGIIDLDEFKNINDRYGHMEGDAVLVDVADTLQKNVGANAVVARFGGDEFVFIMPLTCPDTTVMSERVMGWFTLKEYDVSVGCAILGKDGSNWRQCLDVADKRLYQKKYHIDALE